MSNDNFPKDFENEMFEFLWNSIIHKVKKTHQYLSGEFKMIDYREFITPLKYTWIRRMLHSKSKSVPLLESIIHCNTRNL